MACSSVVDISLCPIRPEIQELLHTQDFEPVYHRFESFGYCSDCRRKAGDGKIQK